MKIDIISDIHLTFYRDDGKAFIRDWKAEGSVLILAGDVGEFIWWRSYPDLVAMLADKYKAVVFVAGNHDYYGTSLNAGDAYFESLDADIDNFYFLEQDIMVVQGVTIAGTSLWFQDTAHNILYEGHLSDFSHIKHFKPAVYNRNSESKLFLEELPRPVDIVVTHHMFSSLSVHEKYKNDPLNIYFLCGIEDTILDINPKVAIHGHTHTPFDYMLGETRVICNPKGYPRENPGKYKAVTVEI